MTSAQHNTEAELRDRLLTQLGTYNANLTELNVPVRFTMASARQMDLANLRAAVRITEQHLVDSSALLNEAEGGTSRRSKP